MNFGAGTGRALGSGRSPPVITIAIAVNTLDRHTNFVPPNPESLVVVQVDSYIEIFRRELKLGGHQFPGESNRIVLEVVANAEVTQHLKKSKVLVVAHFVNIGGAEAFLRTGQPTIRGGLLAHKEGLEGHHSGAGEQECGVSRRNQRRAGHIKVALAFKELDEGTSYLVSGHQCDSPTPFGESNSSQECARTPTSRIIVDRTSGIVCQRQSQRQLALSGQSWGYLGVNQVSLR